MLSPTSYNIAVFFVLTSISLQDEVQFLDEEGAPAATMNSICGSFSKSGIPVNEPVSFEA